MTSRARWCWVVSRLGSKLACSGAPGGPATWTTSHGDLWGISGIAESVEQNWHWAQVTYIHNHIVPQGYDFISFDIDGHIIQELIHHCCENCGLAAPGYVDFCPNHRSSWHPACSLHGSPETRVALVLRKKRIKVARWIVLWNTVFTWC